MFGLSRNSSFVIFTYFRQYHDFVSLLTLLIPPLPAQMMNLEPEKRIDPEAAMKHPFLAPLLTKRSKA